MGPVFYKQKNRKTFTSFLTEPAKPRNRIYFVKKWAYFSRKILNGYPSLPKWPLMLKDGYQFWGSSGTPPNLSILPLAVEAPENCLWRARGALVLQAGYLLHKRIFKTHPKHVFFRYKIDPIWIRIFSCPFLNSSVTIFLYKMSQWPKIHFFFQFCTFCTL